MGSKYSMLFWSPSLPIARITVGKDFASPPSISMKRGRALAAADFRERIDRALAHPPVRVLGCLDQLRDRTLVLGLVENLDGRPADVLVLVLDQREHGIDDARSADLAERVGGPRPHPPIAVGDDFQQVLDRLGGADHVQYLDRGAPGSTRSRP